MVAVSGTVVDEWLVIFWPTGSQTMNLLFDSFSCSPVSFSVSVFYALFVCLCLPFLNVPPHSVCFSFFPHCLFVFSCVFLCLFHACFGFFYGHPSLSLSCLSFSLLHSKAPQDVNVWWPAEAYDCSVFHSHKKAHWGGVGRSKKLSWE